MDLSMKTATSDSVGQVMPPIETKLSRPSSSVSASTLSALAVAALRRRGYPYCSPAYDPLAAYGRGIELFLQKDLVYEDGHDFVYCFEVRNGEGCKKIQGRVIFCVSMRLLIKGYLNSTLISDSGGI